MYRIGHDGERAWKQSPKFSAFDRIRFHPGFEYRIFRFRIFIPVLYYDFVYGYSAITVPILNIDFRSVDNLVEPFNRLYTAVTMVTDYKRTE